MVFAAILIKMLVLWGEILFTVCYKSDSFSFAIIDFNVTFVWTVLHGLLFFLLCESVWDFLGEKGLDNQEIKYILFKNSQVSVCPE